AGSPQAIPQLDGFGEDVISFPHRPLQAKADDLPEYSIEVVRDLTGEKAAVLGEEFSSGLQVVRHVQGASGLTPVRVSNSVEPNRLEEVLSALPFRLQSDRHRRPMEQAVGRSPVASDLAQLGDRCVAQRVVPGAGVNPRIRFVRGNAHRRTPRPQQRRDALDVGKAAVGYLRPGWQTRFLKLNHQKRMLSISLVSPTRIAPMAASPWRTVLTR